MLRFLNSLLMSFIGVLLFIQCQSAQEPWVPLFDGTTLNGWTQYGGNAEYRVVDGEIHGFTVLDSPNSFLSTEQTFGDFILEYEVFPNPEFNSGVQIRSEVSNDNVVFGYQVELDPSPRAWSAGIYDERRRGWLYPLTKNEAAQNAFKLNEWNKIRVEAIGHSIRTWINGVEASSILDDQTAEGFIGLQVHSVNGGDEMKGLVIKFKNINIITENPEAYATEAHTIEQKNYLLNTISDYEASEGWSLLWDGETTNGWRGAKINEFPQTGWKIENGILKVMDSDGAESANGGDIITVDKYENFELMVDFRITEGANSGIKYFVDPNLNMGAGSAIGCEFQILDDARHPDAKLGVNGNRTMAALYDLIPPGYRRVSRIGEWNRARIVVDGNHVEHWLNGVKALEYTRNTPMWDALVDYSKYADWPNFGNFESGHILLQDHGDEVHFSSIKIKTL